MAFCDKCGAKIVDSARVCPSCGEAVLKNQQPAENQPQQQTIRQTSDNNNMGELLVSTKTGAAGRKVLLCVLCPLLILLGIFIMATPEAFYELSHQHYRLIAILIGSVLIGYALFCLITTFLGSRSYCDVYENSVVGMTALSMNQPNMPMQKFAINYSEINNVTETGKTICIYTVYATYEVLALHNRSEAVNEIRKRISKNAEK